MVRVRERTQRIIARRCRLTLLYPVCMWRVALVLVSLAGSAPAETLRREQPFAIGISMPDDIYITGHDATVPLPTLHVGYAVTPLASIELGAGGVPMGHGAYNLLAHLGARYRLTERSLAPFAMVRVGAYHNAPDEGTPATYELAIGGAGLEYLLGSRLALWLDLGAGVVNYADGATLALAGSLGVAFRL